MSHVISKEFGPRGITVNVVSPGATETESYRDGQERGLPRQPRGDVGPRSLGLAGGDRRGRLLPRQRSRPLGHGTERPRQRRHCVTTADAASANARSESAMNDGDAVTLALSREGKPGHEQAFELVLHKLATEVRRCSGHLDLRVIKPSPGGQRWVVGTARRECLDRLLTLGPRHLASVLRECFMHAQTPRRLMAFTRSKLSAGSSAASLGGIMIPALLNAMSSRLNVATVRSTAAPTWASSETSQTTASTR